MKYKHTIVNNWKNNLILIKKEHQIINLENCILKIQEKGLLEQLFVLFDEIGLKQLFLKSLKTSVKEYPLEGQIILYELLIQKIKEESEIMLKKNPIIFKLELYIPKMYDLTLKLLFIWIYNVKINENKLKKDKNKQFFYLIYEFQKGEDLIKKEEIILKLLKKIQFYIKYAK